MTPDLEHERAGDVAAALVQAAQPTDSLPEDAGPPWYTIPEIGKRSTYREGLIPVTTGFVTLDTRLRGGFRPECVYILAGRTGSAKSTLALNIARKVALTGPSVLVLKLEESLPEAVWRMHAAAAQVDLVRLLDGAEHARSKEREALTDGWDLIRRLPIRLSDRRNIVDIERIVAQHAADGGGLVVVDQVSMVEFPGAAVGFERATEISARLRLLARNVHLPIVLVAQVNRLAARGKEHLTCNDLRDSGALENDAAGVLLIDRIREPDAPRWHTDPLTLEILVDKNRYGGKTLTDKPLELKWWPWCCRIEDPPRGDGDNDT